MRVPDSTAHLADRPAFGEAAYNTIQPGTAGDWRIWSLACS
jgi:hypothetical protein